MSEASKSTAWEQRDAPQPFTFDGDGGRPVIRGNPIVFNAWSRVLTEYGGIRFRELIRPDAVDRTLRGADEVLAYWNHNGGQVLGNTAAGTLALRKTPAALAMELHPTPEWLATPEAAGLKRGDVRYMSFGFSVVDDTWSAQPNSDGVFDREIVDMVFSEVSIVGRPAYPQTSVALASRAEVRVMVSPECLERFARGTRVEYLRMVHRIKIA